MNLKELTWENHKKAERKEFASILMSGNIDPALYYKYLSNQYYMYTILEENLRVLGFPAMLYDVFRAVYILEDMKELEDEYGFVFAPANVYPLVHRYVKRIEDITRQKDYNRLLAHMYVRHFGDMYGGAMIKKKVPGSGKMYEFEDKEQLKASLRELLNDDMSVEANACFEYAIELFEELGNESSLGSADKPEGPLH